MTERKSGAIIAVDFDGTCVEHEYPSIGRDCPNAERTLKKLIDNGNRLILLTMRSDKYLEDAVRWFEERGIELFGVNDNPQQREWTNSRKVYANYFIDDAAIGCPLVNVNEGRPFVDWDLIEEMLINKGLIAFKIVRSDFSEIDPTPIDPRPKDK